MPLRALLPLSLLVAGACRGGCTPPPPTGGQPARIRVEDDTGQRVQLPRPARRIAALSPSNTEILFAIGCGKQVVLRDRLSTFPAAARALPSTNPFDISPGHVAGFNPDLVLVSHFNGARLAALRQLGLQVAVFDPKTLQQVYDNMRTIATLCGRQQRAGQLIARLRRRAQRVTRRVRGLPRPRVFIETDGSDPLKPWTAGGGSFVDQLVHLAGGRNIAHALPRPYAQISAEEVLRSDPQLILVMGVSGEPAGNGLERLRSRSGWRDLTAVRKGRVIDDIHPDLLSRPGPRLLDGLERLARRLHPEAER